ncbi:anti-sigma factor [Arthrobacter sp. TMN-49]
MEKQLHLLTGSYALNALESSERNEFERYALTDAETLAEVRSLSETAALLAYGTASETPPPALKADVMAAIRNTRQLPASSVMRDISSAKRHPSQRATSQINKGKRNPWLPTLSAAAALAIFAGVGVGGWVAGQNATQQDMEEQLVAMQEQQKAVAAQQEAMLSIVGSPDAKIATTALSDGGSVTVASSGKANRAAVMVNGLPELPADKTYELWFISAAGAVPAGLMDSADPAVPGMQVLNGPVGGATHVGITVEPAGGSPAPTTTPLVVQAI